MTRDRKAAAVCGVFIPDPAVPPDHNGLQACVNCHLMGRRGDAHHDLPAPPAEDARSLAAGEREST